MTAKNTGRSQKQTPAHNQNKVVSPVKQEAEVRAATKAQAEAEADREFVSVTPEGHEYDPDGYAEALKAVGETTEGEQYDPDGYAEALAEDRDDVVEVGQVAGFVEVDNSEYDRLLQEEAEKRAHKAPPLTQPAVVTSWDEQHDPATHEKVAEESQRALAEREALKEAQDAQYLAGQ